MKEEKPGLGPNMDFKDPGPLDIELWEKARGIPTEYRRLVLEKEHKEKMKKTEEGSFAVRNGFHSELRDALTALGHIFFNSRSPFGWFKDKTRKKKQNTKLKPEEIKFQKDLLDLNKLDQNKDELVNDPDRHKYFDADYTFKQKAEEIDKVIKEKLEEDGYNSKH